MRGLPVILASSSPRRRKLLRQIITRFRVVRPRITEDPPVSTNPIKYARRMARAKAENVSTLSRPALIIAADTVVWNGRQIIGKPRSTQDAFRILKALSGTRHSVITGVCVLNSATGRCRTGHRSTRLFMEKLSEQQLRRIVSQRRHLDKAGGYAIQESGDKHIRIVRGRMDNAVGLPLDLVRQLVRSVSGRGSRSLKL